MQETEITHHCEVPKYEQVIRFVLSDIESGIFRNGDRIPSINETSIEYQVSRDTVEKAYRKLRKRGVLKSVPGKGYFVADSYSMNKLKICILFNKLSDYKKQIYNAFTELLTNRAIIDLRVYNYNFKFFEQIIKSNLYHYDYFVILPHFYSGNTGLYELIAQMQKEKVVIIDRNLEKLNNSYAIVYQDRMNDIVEALEQGLELLKKYCILNLVFPVDDWHSRKIISGFSLFCKIYNLRFNVLYGIQAAAIQTNNAYVIVSDNDLVRCIHIANDKKLEIGRDLGLISYNESPVKELLANGISTISTNHRQIGETAAQMILKHKKGRIRIPFQFIHRNSL